MKKKQPFLQKHLILLLPGLALVVIIGAVWFFYRFTVPPNKFCNVILISIDTCRADYLSCYGFGRKTTPNIDSVADMSIVFENVISPVPLTLPAHSSMLTGTIPPYHGLHNNHNYWLDGSNITLAEILKDNGFNTSAFVSSFIIDSQFGLNQGFDTYYDRFEQQNSYTIQNERQGGETSRLVLEWLEQHKNEKFFLFLHYYDPHSDYQPPEPFASKFYDNLYAGEIAYVDYCISLVIQKLRELGLFDSALIIITSDHGEMLGEHREDEHGYFIYQSAVKVPMILKLPSQRHSKSIKDAVGLIDIVPTVCSLLGIRVPAQVQGEDLSRYFIQGYSSKSGKEKYLYTESLYPTKYNANALLGVVTNRWKYIQTTRPELYDLLNDPSETNNLIIERPQEARILQDQLRQILQLTVRKTQFDSKIALDEESRQRLESLGYVAGSIKEDFEFNQTRNDPKDLIDFHLSISKANSFVSQKKLSEAKSLCQKLLLQHPDFYEIYCYLGKIAFQEGDKEKAQAYMLKSLKINPGQADLHNHVGMLLAEQSKLKEAVDHLTKSLRLNPNQIGVRFALANLFERQNKLDQAVKCYTEILIIEPEMAEAHNNLGSALLRQGKFEQALEHCTKALEINPNLAEAYYNLGNIQFQKGKFEKAIRYYEKALALRPNWQEALMNLNIAKSQKDMP